jgi:hypothetical protein
MVLSLHYGDLSGAVSEAGRLANELGQYCDDLSRRVQQKMSSVEGGVTGALNSADYYINQKIRQLRARETNARALSTKVQTLIDTAKRVDNDVERTIDANRRSFFEKNPELRPPEQSQSFWDFLCGGVEVAVCALGCIIKGVAEVGEWIGGKAKALWDGIVEAWNDGWLQTVATVAVIVAGVVIAALCIATGGIGVFIGAGILAGLISQGISDAIDGELSSFDAYLGSALAGAAGGALGGGLGIAFGGAVGAGALFRFAVGGVDGAVTAFATDALEILSGKSQKSIAEIISDVAIGAAVGGVAGLIFVKEPGIKRTLTDILKKVGSDSVSRVDARYVGELIGSAAEREEPEAKASVTFAISFMEQIKRIVADTAKTALGEPALMAPVPAVRDSIRIALIERVAAIKPIVLPRLPQIAVRPPRIEVVPVPIVVKIPLLMPVPRAIVLPLPIIGALPVIPELPKPKMILRDVFIDAKDVIMEIPENSAGYKEHMKKVFYVALPAA